MAQPTLTASDPVQPEVLARFSELDSARYELGFRLLEIEQERVRILAAAHQVDQQRQRLFEQVLIERGLESGTPVSINDKTGEIKVVERKVQSVNEL
jgi:hypothetical protein